MKSVLVGLLILVMTGSALAATEVTGDASLGLYSKYLWRGYDFGGDANYVVQPEATLGVGGFSLGLWGNYNEATEKLDELDVTFEYSHDLNETFSVRLGHISYAVVDGADSAEAYVGATLSLPVEVGVDAYYEYDETEAWYLSCGVSKGFELSEKVAVTTAATLGYYDFDYLNEGTLSVFLDYAVGAGITVTPGLLFSTPISNEARDAEVDDAVVASINVNYSF